MWMPVRVVARGYVFSDAVSVFERPAELAHPFGAWGGCSRVAQCVMEVRRFS